MQLNHDIVAKLDLDALTKYLIVKRPNVVTQRKIAEQVINKLELEVVNQYLKILSEDENWICRSFSCYILPTCFRIVENKEEVRRMLFRLANDEDWRVRESVAWSFYKLLKDDFETTYHFLTDLSTNNSENVRRAIIMAAAKMGKHREEKYAKPLLDVVRLFLKDKSKYVQKAIIFAIGDCFLRYYPSDTFVYLKTWAKSREIELRWIVGMSLSMAEAREHIEECMGILEGLSFDNSRLVQNAVLKALTNLAQKYPEKVYMKVKSWDNNPNRDYILNEVLQKINKRV